MSKNVYEYEQGETDLNLNKNNITVPDYLLEEFQNTLTIERIKYLYDKLKLYEVKGYVTHNKYLESMKDTLDKVIINKIQLLHQEKKIKNSYFNILKNIPESLNEIYESYFVRFREVKCLMKNDKTVFYLTDYKPVNYISSYNLICSLTVLMKSSFYNKIKLLFALTDIDEDGFLNESEIRYMISTCNYLFCEEINRINTGSTILAQSLMNFKVNDILKQILYEPGNLYLVLEKEKYINFDMLYKSIIKVKDYKYNILPSFINLKMCLKNVKREKTIKVDDKYKKDFITISSALFTQKSFRINRELYKSASSPYLSGIIKPKKITEENNTQESNKYELPNINKNFFYKRQSVLRQTLQNFNNKNKISEPSNEKAQTNFSKTSIGIRKKHSRNINKNKLFIEKRKTLKDLLKETTIIDIDEGKDKKSKTLKNFNRSSYYNKDETKVNYIFETFFDKIRNIEVKPGLIQFVGGTIFQEKEKEKEAEKDKENNTGQLNSQTGSGKKLNNLINNKNNKNINNIKAINQSKRKIIEEKSNNNKYVKMFSFSEKSILGNNDIQNEVIKEEKSSEENDDYKGIQKPPKFKVINSQSKSNQSKNRNKRHVTNTIKRDNKKNLTSFKIVPKTEKTVKIRNYSFHKRPSFLARKKVSIMDSKNAIKVQKSIINTNLKETFRYRTFDEVFSEIKTQEKKFNTDTLGGFGLGLFEITNTIMQEQNELKKVLGFYDKKTEPIFFGKSYLDRLAKNKEEENADDEKKKNV